MISSRELAEKIAVLLDNKNFDIEIMKIEGATILSDYVICSGTTITHCTL